MLNRLSKSESVLKTFNDELQEVLESADHQPEGESMASSSTGSRAERAVANRERIWWDFTTRVRDGELSAKSCQRQLRNKYGMQVQLAHVKQAVSRLQRHLEPMKWVECTETRGRPRSRVLANERRWVARAAAGARTAVNAVSRGGMKEEYHLSRRNQDIHCGPCQNELVRV